MCNKYTVKTVRLHEAFHSQSPYLMGRGFEQLKMEALETLLEQLEALGDTSSVRRLNNIPETSKIYALLDIRRDKFA